MGVRAIVLQPNPAGPAGDSTLDQVELSESGGICWVRLRAGNDAPPALDLAARPLAATLTTDIDANWKALIEALLGDVAWRFVWPLAFVAADGSALRQIVPRTFLRTRVIDLVFAGDIEAVKARAAAARQTAEACQAARAAGDAIDASPALADFFAQLGAACTD